jgi:hypothetical protein
MIQNILSHLGGVEHFGIVSLCLFCTVFIGVLFWTFLQNKSHLEYMSRVALDHESEETAHRFRATADALGDHTLTIPGRAKNSMEVSHDE